MRRIISGAGVVVGSLALGLGGAATAQADPTFTLTVTVTSAGGAGIPDVYVEVFGDAGDGNGTTGAGGTFSTTLPAGSYTLDVENPLTYAEIERTVVVGADTSTTVAIPGAQVVSGVVDDTAGHGLAGVSVDVSSTTGSIGDDVQTAADGSYVAVVAAGTFRVQFSHYDSGTGVTDYGTLYYPSTYDYAKAGQVKVTAGHDVTLSTVKLAKNGTVTGKVTAAGKAVASHYVDVEGTNGVQTGATTDATGTYTVLAPPGSYAAGVYPDGNDSWLATYSGSTVRKPDAKHVTLTDGGSATANIATVAGATVQGKVVDQHGKPVKGAYVGLSNTTRTGYGSATTDAAGHYVARGLATGSVDVYASAGARFGHTTVTATQGKTVTARTTTVSAPTGAVAVTAKVTTGKVTAVQVALLDSKKRAVDLRNPPKSGKVTFSHVAKGTYYVTITGTNVAKKVKVGTKKVSAGTIKAAKFTTIKGTVKTSAGAAAKGGTVYVYDAYGAFVATTAVGSAGKYSLTHVVSGKVRIVFDPAQGSHDAAVAATATVKKGHALTKNAKLVRSGTFVGVVKNSKGAAVTGIVVWGGGGSAETSTSGHYSLADNPPGATSLYAYDPYTGGYHNKVVKATARSGKTVTVKTITVS